MLLNNCGNFSSKSKFFNCLEFFQPKICKDFASCKDIEIGMKLSNLQHLPFFAKSGSSEKVTTHSTEDITFYYPMDSKWNLHMI